MVRSVGITAVVLGLAWTGLAAAQSLPGPDMAPSRERFITVREEGKPPQRCKLIKAWHEPNGVPAYQVQAVDTGEQLTIVGSGPPAGGEPRVMSTRIFRWGSSNTPPAGAPQAPAASTMMPAPTRSGSPNLTSIMPPASPSTPMQAPLTQSSPYVRQGNTEKPTRALPQQSPNVRAWASPPVPANPKVMPDLTADTLAASQPQIKSAPLLSSKQPTPTILTGRPTQGSTATTLIAPTPALPTPALPTPTPQNTFPAASNTLNHAPVPAPIVGNSTPLSTPMSTQVIQSPLLPTPNTRETAVMTSPQPRLVPSSSTVVGGPVPGNCNCPTTCETCCQPSQPCSSSSCVSCTPSPMRQSFISRLFKPHSSCPPCECCTEVVCETKPAAPAAPATVAAPPAPMVTKIVTETPRPRDWRESWGKVEPWKATAETASAKPVEVPSRRVEPAPVKMEVPREPDPIKNPDLYRDIAMSTRLSNSKIPEEIQPGTAPSLKERLFAHKHAPEATPPTSPSAPPASMAAEAPQGTPSPMRAPGRSIELPANEANAFWSPPQPPDPKSRPNPGEAAEARPPSQANPPRIAPGYAGPMPPPGPMQPRLPMMPMRPDSGVGDALGNAFTLPGTRRPIPADFGGTPQEPNGFDPAVRGGQGSPPIAYGMGMPAMPRPPMPNMMAMGQQAPMMPNPYMQASSVPVPPPGSAVASAHPSGTPQLLSTLKDSLYPSEREAAAEQLSELNARAQPQVVESLVQSARKDPAATVRAACVHALTRMKANGSEMTALARDLKSDRDPRVRQEAEEALNALGDSGVQQASHR